MSSEKVVLVVPPLVHSGIAFTSVAGPEHIGVAYLAASLRREGLATVIANFDLDTYLDVIKQEGFVEVIPDPIQMAEAVLEEDPAFVGVTVTGPTLDTSLQFATEIKRRRPDVHVCFGGHQATAAAEPLMAQESVIDSIGLGDCDFTLPVFVKAVLKGSDLQEVDGFYSRRSDGSVVGGWKAGVRKGELLRIGRPADKVESETAQRYALWDLPHPSRDDLARIRSETNANEARLSTSRGCMDFCTFCATADRAGFRRHTLRPPDDVIEEIEDLHSRYGIDHFWLVDDNFVSRAPESQERASAICEALLKSPLKTTMRAYFRADAFDGRADLIELMFRAGVTMGLIGVESGTPRRLRYFGKHCTSEQVRSTVSAIRSVGMGLQIGYIFFDPMTSLDDMRQDADFLLEIDEAYNLYNFAQNMDVYPGTPYRRMIQKNGLGHFEHEYRGGFRLYDFEDPRIAPLSAAMDQVYDAQLGAIDRALMRLRAFNLPRLRWLGQRGMLTEAQSNECAVLNEDSERWLGQLAGLNHAWMLEAIDNAERGFDRASLDASMAELKASRLVPLRHLEALGRKAQFLAGTVHAHANGHPSPRPAETEEAAWPIS